MGNIASAFRASIRLENHAVCSAAPNPGNTVFVQGSGCSGTKFSMQLQNTINAPDVTYQWQSADDIGFTVNVTALGTSGGGPICHP